MIFSLQRYIEDYLDRRGLNDIDQYSIRLANLYFQQRDELSADDFLKRMKRIRTVIFVNKSAVDRSQFEANLLRQLDGLKKKP